MNTLIASYEPDAHGVPLTDAVIRLATRDDLPFTAALSAQREGASASEWAALHERRYDDDRQMLVVAEYDGEIIGHAWITWLTPVADGGRNAPDGWYLSGVVVAPAFRRRGIGRRLTQARIDWALERDGSVLYVVSAANRASRTLHAELGFREVADDFCVPSVVFGNDDGILCRLDEHADADVVPLAPRMSTAAGPV